MDALVRSDRLSASVSATTSAAVSTTAPNWMLTLGDAECAVLHVVPALGGRCTKSRRIGSRVIPFE